MKKLVVPTLSTASYEIREKVNGDPVKFAYEAREHIKRVLKGYPAIAVRSFRIMFLEPEGSDTSDSSLDDLVDDITSDRLEYLIDVSLPMMTMTSHDDKPGC